MSTHTGPGELRDRFHDEETAEQVIYLETGDYTVDWEMHTLSDELPGAPVAC
ncbi:MAG: hypothetical protein M0Z87_02310 [Actinomycetota bacterium]|nr:hypothetical protein [Actinomycetota bacterium]